VSTFSRKFNEAQLKYTVTEQELLAILESCKHFKSIIHGYNVTVHTDHKNLTYSPTQCANARVERLMILLNEEFGVTIEHIKGKDNTSGDGLSRLAFLDTALETDAIFTIQDMDRDKNHMFPLNMHQILKEQVTDEKLQEKIKDKKKRDDFGKQKYDNIEVTTYKGKVWVPKSLQTRLIDWFHDNLDHAGSTRTVNSILQILGFPALKRMVEEIIKSCGTCQRHKQSNKKLYGKLPLVSALRDKEPLECIHVDCIGPFKIQVEDANKRAHILEIHCLTMADSCTSWSEATPLLNHSAKYAAKKFDKAWLCSKLCPLQVVHNNRTKFIGAEFQEILSSYNIEPKCTTVKNPNANALVERLHSTLEDQLRTKILGKDFVGKVDYLIQIALFANRATTPSNCAYLPSQLAYGVDMIFRQKILIDWVALKQVRQLQAVANNAKENKKRLGHIYKVDNLILIVKKPYELAKAGKITLPTYSEGPYRILKLYENGAVKIQCGSFTDNLSIRRIMPYYSRNN
jgi:hypothetical protein